MSWYSVTLLKMTSSSPSFFIRSSLWSVVGHVTIGLFSVSCDPLPISCDLHHPSTYTASPTTASPTTGGSHVKVVAIVVPLVVVLLLGIAAVVAIVIATVCYRRYKASQGYPFTRMAVGGIGDNDEDM